MQPVVPLKGLVTKWFQGACCLAAPLNEMALLANSPLCMHRSVVSFKFSCSTAAIQNIHVCIKSNIIPQWGSKPQHLQVRAFKSLHIWCARTGILWILICLLVNFITEISLCKVKHIFPVVSRKPLPIQCTLYEENHVRLFAQLYPVMDKVKSNEQKISIATGYRYTPNLKWFEYPYTWRCDGFSFKPQGYQTSQSRHPACARHPQYIFKQRIGVVWIGSP